MNFLKNQIKLIQKGIFQFCAEGDLNSIQTVISMDVDYNIQDEHENGHLNVVEFLILKGLDPNCKTKDDATPLHAACYNGHLPVVEFLISK